MASYCFLDDAKESKACLHLESSSTSAEPTLVYMASSGKIPSSLLDRFLERLHRYRTHPSWAERENPLGQQKPESSPTARTDSTDEQIGGLHVGNESRAHQIRKREHRVQLTLLEHARLSPERRANRSLRLPSLSKERFNHLMSFSRSDTASQQSAELLEKILPRRNKQVNKRTPPSSSA